MKKIYSIDEFDEFEDGLDIVDILEDAVESRNLIEFDYITVKGRRTHRRKGEPYEVRDAYYLWLWDHTRGAIRRFVIDGISNLSILPKKFSPRF